MKKLVIEWTWNIKSNGIDEEGIADLQMVDVATIKVEDVIVDVIEWKYNDTLRTKREERIIKNYCKDDIKFYDSIRN